MGTKGHLLRDVFDVSLKSCLITQITLRVRPTVRGERRTEVVLPGAGENQGVLTDCEKKAQA